MRCKDEEIGQLKRPTTTCDASPQLPISTNVQSLDRSRLPWSVPLDHQGQLSSPEY